MNNQTPDTENSRLLSGATPTSARKQLDQIIDLFRRFGVNCDYYTCGATTEIAADLWTLNIMLWNVYMANRAVLHQPECEMDNDNLNQLLFRILGPAGFLIAAALPGWQLRQKAKYFIRHFNNPQKYYEEPHGFDDCADWVKRFICGIEEIFIFFGGMSIFETFMPKEGNGFDCVANFYTKDGGAWFFGQILCGYIILRLMRPRIQEMYLHRQPSNKLFAGWAYFAGSTLGKLEALIDHIYRSVKASGKFSASLFEPVGEATFGAIVSYLSMHVMNAQFKKRSSILPQHSTTTINDISKTLHKITISTKTACAITGITLGNVSYNALSWYSVLQDCGVDGGWIAILLLGLATFFILTVYLCRSFGSFTQQFTSV
jgi:hypothetical protein